MGELRADVDRLVLMSTESETERTARDSALELVQTRLERQALIIERMTKVYQSLSAGGAASIWAAAQKGTARRNQDESPDGPESAPISRFIPKRLRENAPQVAPQEGETVDAEVLPEG